MKKMRCLFLVLALGFVLCAQRAQGQTIGQTMTFSIICQYVTNTYATNTITGTVDQYQHILTVLIDTANIVKAIAIDTYWTNYLRWDLSDIVYEQNLADGNQGIYLRYAGKQTNVSSFFTNIFSTNGYANMFSQDASNVLGGTNYTITGTNPTTLPLHGGLEYLPTSGRSSNIFTASDNLAYLTFSSSNTSFTLFGFSQGTLIDVLYQGNVVKVDRAEIVGAGTFSLNLSTNFLRVTNGYPHVDTNVVPATNFTGLAHGTVYVSGPYYLDVAPPEGP